MTESERCRFFDGGVCLHEKFEGATEVSDLFCAQCLDRLPMKKWLGPVPETNHRSLRDRICRLGRSRGAGLGLGKGQRYERIGSHLGTDYVKTGG